MTTHELARELLAGPDVELAAMPSTSRGYRTTVEQAGRKPMVFPDRDDCVIFTYADVRDAPMTGLPREQWVDHVMGRRQQVNWGNCEVIVQWSGVPLWRPNWAMIADDMTRQL